ncbi:hypothetical protein HID58_022172 [Brassica napus]|uniref:Autophagy-related protein 13 N-terminal domain-containing protein n=1 Tax=Brassica napus TaxID=3708 RepID=A0ABQ8CYI3_BRANA|nr:hypothetical protein HID58_022172 [Brassica napus]
MGDRPWGLDKLHSWHRNILVDSMIIDIILVHPHHHLETVMERWAAEFVLIYKVSSFRDDVLSGDVKEFRLYLLVVFAPLLLDLSEFNLASFQGRACRPHSGFHRPSGHYVTPNQSFSPGLHNFHDGFGGDSHQLSPRFSRLGSPSTPRYVSGTMVDRNPLPPSCGVVESNLLSSSGSPRFGFSRSPSRLSSADDLDDPDCSCPFDFDDVDESGLQYTKSLDRRKISSSISQSLPIGRESQDAAVGVLVQMLKTAPPLRQDLSAYMASMSGVQGEGSVSGTV